MLRYDGETGTFLGGFVPPEIGGPSGPAICLPPDGLYVSSFVGDSVLRFNSDRCLHRRVWSPIGRRAQTAPEADHSIQMAISIRH